MAFLTDPPKNWQAISKNDTTVYPPFRMLYVGSGGDVTVRCWPAGNTVTFTAVQTGSHIIGSFDQLRETGTDASAILRGWG